MLRVGASKDLLARMAFTFSNKLAPINPLDE